MKAAAGGGKINIEDLGMGSAEDIVSGMEEREKLMEEMDKPYEQKLAEQKEADKKHQEEMDERKLKENPRAPHLVNLNEDPQLSQKIYNALKEFPVRVGRKNENPKPQIIFGGVSVQKNHAKFEILENGLIQMEITNESALEQTLINGKQLDPENPKQVLNHLDTIYFGSNQMLLFKYPQMKRYLMLYKQEIQEEQNSEHNSDEEEEKVPQEKEKLDEDEIETLAYNKLMELGVRTNDPDLVICEDYEDDEIKNDHQAIDWETAFAEVERVEEEKKQMQMNAIKEAERQRLEQEFLAKQEEEKLKEQKMMQELAAKQEVLLK